MAEYAGATTVSTTSLRLSTNAICVDGAPEDGPGGSAGIGKSKAYTIEVITDSGVPSPPYISNKALSCVVCTK